MGHTMIIAVLSADLTQLDAYVDAQKTTETRWQAAAEQQADLLDLRGPALRAARAQIRGERDRLREAGTHRVTRWRALAPALRAELDARGLLREWETIPEGAQQAGQNLGGAGPYGGAESPARPQPVTWAPSQTGPCARCHAPTCRYGVGASPLCASCKAARQAQYGS